MNAALKAYLKDLQSSCASDTGTAYAVQKCIGIVSKARSTINPTKIELFKYFGDYICQRVRGHFSQEEHCEDLQRTPTGDVAVNVRIALDGALSQGSLSGKALSRKLRGEIERTRDALDGFLSLEDARDVIMLRPCTSELSALLGELFPPVRKRRAVSAANSGQRAAPKRQKSSRAQDALSAEVEQAAAPLRKIRPCRQYTGGWAIMVALHSKDGGPCTRDELANISAQLGLCNEPLLRIQSTVANAGQYYSPWSGCKKLQEGGWVVRVGQRRFQLTSAGKVEAAAYVKQWEELKGSGSQIDVSRSQANAARPSGMLPQTRTFNALRATSSVLDLDSDSSLEQEAHKTPEEDIDMAGSEEEHRLGSEGIRSHAEGDEGTLERSSVLVDVNEKPVVRAELQKLLPSCAEVRIFGVDYAFGQRSDNDWLLDKVLIERKTVHDFLATFSNERGDLQSRVQETLLKLGFQVAVLLEGTHELKQHPKEMEILTAAYGCNVDVLTTASIHETADFLAGIAAEGCQHDGWTLNSLPVVLHPIYELDQASVCEAALKAAGIGQPIAEKLAGAFHSLPLLLAQLPRAGDDLEVVVASLAATAEIALYQAGKALRIIGVQNAPLSRKVGARNRLSCTDSDRRRWKAGVLKVANACVEVGPGLPNSLRAVLRSSLCIEDVSSMDQNTLRVRRGVLTKLFALGDGSELTAGKHWLIVLNKLDRREVARHRAHAYVCEGVVSSMCSSPGQAARHVVACAHILGDLSCQDASVRIAGSATKLSGLAGVLHFARTAGGNLPLAVADNLAQALQTTGCTKIYELVQKLREHGPGYITSLKVRDIGPERASAIHALLIDK